MCYHAVAALQWGVVVISGTGRKHRKCINEPKKMYENEGFSLLAWRTKPPRGIAERCPERCAKDLGWHGASSAARRTPDGTVPRALRERPRTLLPVEVKLRKQTHLQRRVSASRVNAVSASLYRSERITTSSRWRLFLLLRARLDRQQLLLAAVRQNPIQLNVEV